MKLAEVLAQSRETVKSVLAKLLIIIHTAQSSNLKITYESAVVFSSERHASSAFAHFQLMRTVWRRYNSPAEARQLLYRPFTATPQPWPFPTETAMHEPRRESDKTREQ